jgi:hypothetical protein
MIGLYDGTAGLSRFETYPSGVFYAPDIRSSIFYDNNNTAYYIDGNNESRLYRLRVGPYAGSSTTGNTAGLEIRNNDGTGDNNLAAIAFHCSSYYGAHLHLRHDGYFGVGGWSASAWRWYVNLATADMFAEGSVRTPIFYDSNNTAYYVDPAATSQLYSVVFNNPASAKFANPYYEWRRANNTRNGYIQFQDGGTLLIDNEAGSDSYLYGLTNAQHYLFARNGYSALFLYSSGTNTSYLIFANGTSGERFRLYGDNGRTLYMSGNSGSTNHFSFDSSGNFIALANITAYGTPSDRKFKENIQDLPNALDKVLKLRPVTFDWKEETPQNSQVNLVNDVGFIAQEVQEVIPDLVRDFDGSLSLRERGLIAYLVQAIKEQQAHINKLEQMIKEKL